MPQKKVKKRKTPQKNTPLPSKIKLRKHLNADALFSTIRQEFEKIPEFRKGDPLISIADSLMSSFAMFNLKSPSLLKFDERRQDVEELQNLQNIYGIGNVPCDSRMREINDEIDPQKNISPAFNAIFRHLQRGKAFEQLTFYKGCYLLNLDGTGIFSSKKIKSPSCLVKKNKKTKELSYYLQMLGAAIVHPDFKEVIPLCPEMIIKQDGQTKNDCERNAAKRFFEKLRKNHPHLPLIINEDALSPNAPHIKDLENHNLHYILGVKPGDHAFLFNTVENAVQENRAIKFTYDDQNDSDLTHTFLIVNDVPLNKSNQDVRVNFIEYWEYSKKKDKTIYHNSWVTDFILSKNNAYTIMRGGRARWKIENETFNTLKNQGYHLEHNFGLGKKHLAEVFTMLMMLAFLVDQTQQLCCALFQALLAKLGNKKTLWGKIRSFFECYNCESMVTIYKALLYGFEKKSPIILENSS
jgi:hypothetical protein